MSKERMCTWWEVIDHLEERCRLLNNVNRKAESLKAEAKEYIALVREGGR